MSKQDRQGVRKASDVELKYNLGQIASAQGATAKQALALQQLAQTLSQYMTDNSADLDEINKRIDEFEKMPGEPGFSPLIDVTEIDGGHRITITDAENTESFDIMNGKNATSNLIEDEFFTGCFYCLVGGEKAWLNPPMGIDIEYRTLERYECQPVYVKVVDFGALPNATRKTIQTGINGQYAIDMQFNIHMQGSQLTHFPYVSSTYEAITRAFISTAGELTVDAKTNLSSYTAKVIIKYIKPKEL